MQSTKQDLRLDRQMLISSLRDARIEILCDARPVCGFGTAAGRSTPPGAINRPSKSRTVDRMAFSAKGPTAGVKLQNSLLS